jgi:PIN domain nuclease of toxin-antitoxin system
MRGVSNVNVLDASAILAYLQAENGQDVGESALDAGPCWMKAVNYCEVLSCPRLGQYYNSAARSG